MFCGAQHIDFTATRVKCCVMRDVKLSPLQHACVHSMNAVCYWREETACRRFDFEIAFFRFYPLMQISAPAARKAFRVQYTHTLRSSYTKQQHCVYSSGHSLGLAACKVHHRRFTKERDHYQAHSLTPLVFIMCMKCGREVHVCMETYSLAAALLLNPLVAFASSIKIIYLNCDTLQNASQNLPKNHIIYISNERTEQEIESIKHMVNAVNDA
jgi:hypothetical protein